MGFKMKGFTPFTQSNYSEEEQREALEKYLKSKEEAKSKEANRMRIHTESYLSKGRKKDQSSPMTQTNTPPWTPEDGVPNFDVKGVFSKLKKKLGGYTKQETEKYNIFDKKFVRNNPPTTIPRTKLDSLKKVDGFLPYNYDYKFQGGKQGTDSLNFRDFEIVSKTGKRRDKMKNPNYPSNPNSKQDTIMDTRKVNLIPKSHYNISDIYKEQQKFTRTGLTYEERKDAEKNDPRLSDKKLDAIWRNTNFYEDSHK